MKYLIASFFIMNLSSGHRNEKEYIAIIHVGASDKPIYPTIISKDSIGETVWIKNRPDKDERYYKKSENYPNALNYIVDSVSYSKLEKLITNYKGYKKAEENDYDYDFIIYINGCKTHTFYLEYKDTVKFFNLLIESSEEMRNSREVQQRLQDVFTNYYKGRN